MFPELLIVSALTLQACLVSASPLERRASPTVTLDSATFTGSTEGKVSRFLGIPYASPPVGDLRYRLPVPIGNYTGRYDASQYGPACPQQALEVPSVPDGLAADAANWVINKVYNAVVPDDEDCLTINVIRPANTKPDAKLPVALWIFGGGFTLGAPAMYDGGILVERSIALGEPVVFVSMNYRLNGLGFLAGKEVQDAGIGNLGMRDQRVAFQWVNRYISAFGGDPTKVTLFGESAGAIAISIHMLYKGGDTEGLYRGAFMMSGSPIPVGDTLNGEKYFNKTVEDCGCADAADRLDCLRKVPYKTLKAAIDHSPGILSYQSLSIAWLPRPDNDFLTGNPLALVQSGGVSSVPFVSGDCADEGTIFGLSSLNTTTDAQFKKYIHDYFLSNATDADIQRMGELYPEDPRQGSPFDTGILYALTPQYKRLSAFLGDAVFQAPRRAFLKAREGKQKTWSYLSKRLKAVPILGAAHTTDLLNAFYGGELGDYLIHFVNNLDPNGGGLAKWPEYSQAAPSLMTFNDNIFSPLSITQDTYRKEQMEFLAQVLTYNPI